MLRDQDPQKFVTVHSSVHNLFNQDCALHRRDNVKANRTAGLAAWRGLLAE
jgi:putative transposase